MARPLRIQGEGMIHHVLARGNRKVDIFTTDRDREKYIELIKKYKERYQFKLYAYCLMNNHIHLLIEEGPVNLSRIMQGIQQSYTQYVNKKYKTTGHVFEQRYKSKPCTEDAYFERLIAYIHNNPVESGVVKTCKEYNWSGHNEIVQEGGDILIDKSGLYSLIGNDGIKNYFEIMNNFTMITEEIVEKAYLSQEEIEEKIDENRLSFSLKNKGSLEIEEINEMIENLSESNNKRIKSGTYNKLFIPIAYKYGRSSRSEIAQYLGISGSRVSNINRMFEEGEYSEELYNQINKLLKENL